jgi:hypothetical protein
LAVLESGVQVGRFWLSDATARRETDKLVGVAVSLYGCARVPFLQRPKALEISEVTASGSEGSKPEAGNEVHEVKFS